MLDLKNATSRLHQGLGGCIRKKAPPPARLDDARAAEPFLWDTPLLGNKSLGFTPPKLGITMPLPVTP